ncbi:MAG: lysostaphin resistance A-like protein [Candidatus Helarchaeota archaeon]
MNETKKWNWTSSLVGFFLILVLNFFFLSAIQFGLLTVTGWEFHPVTGELIHSGSIWGVWLGTIIGEIIILLVTLFLAISVYRGRFQSFNFRIPPLKHLLMAIGGAFAAYGLSLLGGILQTFLTGPDPNQATYNALFHSSNALELTGWLIVMIVIVGPCEELFARGFVQQGLQNSCENAQRSKYLAVLLASILFASLHLDYFRFIPLFFVGLILGLVYYYTNNSFAATITHGLYNSIGILLFFLLP